jgi:hypothetical protein
MRGESVIDIATQLDIRRPVALGDRILEVVAMVAGPVGEGVVRVALLGAESPHTTPKNHFGRFGSTSPSGAAGTTHRATLTTGPNKRLRPISGVKGCRLQLRWTSWMQNLTALFASGE